MGTSLPALYAISWFKRGAETRQAKKTFSCVFFLRFFFPSGACFSFSQSSAFYVQKKIQAKLIEAQSQMIGANIMKYFIKIWHETFVTG